jgi:phosphoribosylformimino-5-aminoimidazole carboxamide ribonucleotide (ProFAR) isomerase
MPSHYVDEEKGEVQAKGIDNILNKMTVEHLPSIGKQRVIYAQVAFRSPNRKDQKRKNHKHIIIKSLSIKKKERKLNASREKQGVTCKGKTIRIK